MSLEVVTYSKFTLNIYM